MAFHYNVHPNSRGKFSCQPHFQGTVVEADHIAAIAAAAGITVAQATAALTAHYTRVFADGADTLKYDNFLKLVDIQPTAGGSHPDPTFPGTVANVKPDLSWALSKPGRAKFETGITFIRDAEMGQKTPIITQTTDLTNQSHTSFTAGKGMLLDGHDLAFDPADTAQGVFFTDTSSGTVTPVAGTDYLQITPSQVRFIVPSVLTSSQTVSIRVKIGATIRTFIYPVVL